MNTNINNYIINSKELEWQPLIEKGIHYEGVFVKPLRYDEITKRSPSILLKFNPGASYPYHNHPAGEELFVLKGNCMVNEANLSAGDYLYTPATFKHSVKSITGCELFLNIPKEVEIL